MKETNLKRKVLLALGIAALVVSGAAAQDLQQATFAGGCFWCMEKPFDNIDGVVSTISGYTGGHVVNPTYQQVTAGRTGHLEAIQITYDPAKVSYEELLYVYWRNVDPLDGGGQFCDRGESYTAAIFYRTDEELSLALQSREKVAEILGRDIEVTVREFDAYYDAEEYHQDYYIKNPIRYAWYRNGCGRDRRLSEVWAEEAATDEAQLWLGRMN